MKMLIMSDHSIIISFINFLEDNSERYLDINADARNIMSEEPLEEFLKERPQDKQNEISEVILSFIDYLGENVELYPDINADVRAAMEEALDEYLNIN